MGCPSPPLDAELFLREVLQCCENRPLFLVDKGWYPDAFKSWSIGVKPGRA